MIHRAVTIKCGKAERVQGVNKERPPRSALEAPTPSGESHSLVTPQSSQSCLSLATPPPSMPSPLSQSLLFPIRINHPVLCLLCKPPPSPEHTVPSTGAAASPTRSGASAGKEWMEEGSPFYLHPGGPIQQPASQGTGAPTAAASDDLTLLPTWIPPGLERALTLGQLVLGTLAPRLPRLELISHISVLRGRG